MSEGGYKIRDQGGVYYLTFTVVNWIDVFTSKNIRASVIMNWVNEQKRTLEEL